MHDVISIGAKKNHKLVTIKKIFNYLLISVVTFPLVDPLQAEV